MIQQAKQRIDHIAITVYLENLDLYVERFSTLLGVTFDPIIHSKEADVAAALSWDSGLELVAPLSRQGYFWDRLQRFGEGVTSLIFGVDDMDEAIARVRSMNVDSNELRFSRRSFPWLHRFESFREVMLVDAFPREFALDIALSQIVPRNENTPSDAECKFYYGIDGSGEDDEHTTR